MTTIEKELEKYRMCNKTLDSGECADRYCKDCPYNMPYNIYEKFGCLYAALERRVGA